MSVFNGTLFEVKFGVIGSESSINLQVDCSISLSQSVREVTTKKSVNGGDREVMPAIRSASGSFSGVVDIATTDVDVLVALMTAQTLSSFIFGGTDGTNTLTLTATGALTSLELSAGVEDNVTISGSMDLNWPTLVLS